MSINESIYLSGKIVAEQLTYYDEMTKSTISDSTLDILDFFVYRLETENETRNYEAIRIDEMTADEIFSEQLGICRNYAPLNQQIFEILKKHNKNLNNTIMTTYIPEDLGHALGLPHAWNKVYTIEKEKGKIILSATYVDPTFLDTRAQKEGELEAYNAFDEGHYFTNLIKARQYTAELLSVLGDYRRTDEHSSLSQYIQDEEKTIQYRKAGIDAYHNTITARILDDSVSIIDIVKPFRDAAQLTLPKYELLDFYLHENEETPVGEVDYEGIEKLAQTYEIIKQKMPEDLNKKVYPIITSDYNESTNEISNGQMNMSLDDIYCALMKFYEIKETK